MLPAYKHTIVLASGILGLCVGAFGIFLAYASPVTRALWSQRSAPVYDSSDYFVASGIISSIDSTEGTVTLVTRDPYRPNEPLSLSIRYGSGISGYRSILRTDQPIRLTADDLRIGMYANMFIPRSGRFTADWVSIHCRADECML